MKEAPIWKQALVQIASGGSAGFVEICIMHPLDLVKTRLQLQGVPRHQVIKKDMTSYSGIIDCFRKMYVTEGPTSFWKGILPPIIAETPKRAIKFCSFEQYKQFFMFGSPTATPLTFSLAGLAAGFTEAVVVNPFEVVKVTMQANKKKSIEAPSTWLVTRNIIKENGWGSRGLSKGITATLMRNGVFNCFYLGFYNSVKNVVPPMADPVHEFGRKVLIGFVSGTVASCLNIPFDVAKSRIQGPQPVEGEIKYSGTLRTMEMVYREEGMLALYKGLLPKILRLGPGGAIMLVVYDYMSEFLSEQF
ncbi:mitochondrial 2-oxodicarboxylate carrier [Atheta coriaria]|uniref:mitochondrial 2-oxodicarboxylate carrier n=1 Tax=Dalotia coriaria TaxID=877792 RepID=UPI0031F35AA2